MQPVHTNLLKLATRLGLSVSTVSRVLSGKGTGCRISSRTQERVLKAARESGFVVNQIARGLRLQKTQSIGLVVPDIANPFFARLARAIERAARQHGYSILLADSQELTPIEIESVQLMRGREVDGLIVAPVGDVSEHLELIARSGKPLVLMDRTFNHLDIPSVASDNHYGGLLAVRHLAAAGHRHIACLQGAPGNEANRERVRGLRDGLQELELPCRDEQIVGEDYSVESGHDAVMRALELRPRPTAFVALGNLIALGAMSAFREANLLVPEDVSLVSYDEQPWAAVLSPPLTTIAQPVDEMGRYALDLLLSYSELTRNLPKRMMFPVSLISRESVAAPAASA